MQLARHGRAAHVQIYRVRRRSFAAPNGARNALQNAESIRLHAEHFDPRQN